MKNNAGDSIVIGGGCFWCIEAVFSRIEGVTNAVSGYAGGTIANPSYQEVSSGLSGHAEVVIVEFEPAAITLAEILDIFFQAHDPTTINRQGADVGPQYRSIIFYKNEEQKNEIQKAIERAQNDYKNKIVTELQPLGMIYRAEEYHQDYYEINKNASYCRLVILPKLQKLKLK
ncbi:MAG: peptide-methionine (S)-S-oxide reductase MsrA [Spirochaetales bacterium]|nr:peptide-methionine (S)-S-oxide reductase MsrA [Spirochaetales bacterium]